MAIFGPLTVIAVAAVPIPMSVNDAVLGDAKDFAFSGPGRVCVGELAFDTAPQEMTYLSYSGIHSLRLETRTDNGTLSLEFGDFAARHGRRSVVMIVERDFKIYRVSSRKEPSYVVSLKDEFESNKFVPRLRVTGSRLRGGRADMLILRRLAFVGEKQSSCAITYDYGWGVLMDGDPIVTRQKEKTR